MISLRKYKIERKTRNKILHSFFQNFFVVSTENRIRDAQKHIEKMIYRVSKIEDEFNKIRYLKSILCNDEKTAWNIIISSKLLKKMFPDKVSGFTTRRKIWPKSCGIKNNIKNYFPKYVLAFKL